ncbi:2-(hydroxymethyl)glutarate dehydrogenase [Sporomusa carbonis]|uniref:NAD(P)-dependent oxidoreductase n=1 Tax=Sporomusa carbonis TaxID=3076075 RepID=UPI003A61F273
MKTSVGFIGLGAMGKPMAKNLIKAGFPLYVYDLNPAPVEELVALGAKAAATPKELASNCGTVITMLPNSPHVESVLSGDNGVLAGMATGGTIIDMSSIAPGAAKKLAAMAAEKGVNMIDAPVTGGVVGAEAGTLAILVGGAKEVFEKSMPILEAMGKSIVRFGEIGAGQTAKMVNQIIVGIQWAAVAEAWTIGVKAGADPVLLQEVLGKGAARCFAIERMPNNMLVGNFEPGFAIDLQHKDLCLALDTSRDLQVPLNLTSTALQYYEAARALGFGKKDHSAVVKVLQNITGVDISVKKKAE